MNKCREYTFVLYYSFTRLQMAFLIKKIIIHRHRLKFKLILTYVHVMTDEEEEKTLLNREDVEIQLRKCS